jgi:probable phosphoglycerate mutase
MQYTRIIAVRHGETAWNAQRRIQGQLDIALNDHGRWQAGRLAMALSREPVTAVYGSGLGRADETARTIAEAAGLTAMADAGLLERHLGRFQGLSFDEVDASWPEEAQRWRRREIDWRPDGGESLRQLHARVEQTVHALAERHAGGLLVLVTHGGVLDLLYRMATGQALDSIRTWLLGNAAINRLLWSPPRTLSLVGWSDTAHLEDESVDEISA